MIDFDEVFALMVTAFLAVLGILLLSSLAADHSIRCYYPEAQATDAGIAYKIIGDVDWGEDIKAYSFNNSNDAIATLQTLKQCAAKE